MTDTSTCMSVAGIDSFLDAIICNINLWNSLNTTTALLCHHELWNLTVVNRSCTYSRKWYPLTLVSIPKKYCSKYSWCNICWLPLSVQPAEGGGLKLSFQLTVSESRRQTTYVAFCFPFSYTECQKMLNRLEAQYSSEVVRTDKGDCSTLNQQDLSLIYFHR